MYPFIVISCRRQAILSFESYSAFLDHPGLELIGHNPPYGGCSPVENEQEAKGGEGHDGHEHHSSKWRIWMWRFSMIGSVVAFIRLCVC